MVETNGQAGFREHLPDLKNARFAKMQQQDAHEYALCFKQDRNPPWVHALWQHWQELFYEPFRGITNDGVVRKNLFALQDQGVPIAKITKSAQALLNLLSPGQRDRVCYHIDSPEWRSWSNPEFLLSDKGIRLDEVQPEVRDATLQVLRETLSDAGYQKAISAMRINGFLGQLVDAPAVCNEYSYNFAMFGRPSELKPWGFSLYGHHLCLNIFLHRTLITIAPWFTGAEPNEIDEGAFAGTTILRREERLGLELMQSLPNELKEAAQVYKLMNDPKMPPGRWNRDDQRHMCGAYRDNRVVPYEGILVSSMPVPQQMIVGRILAEYLLYLPGQARTMQLSTAQSFFEETYFCWIGGYSANDAFYYRIQSPVIIVEFDHHSGVFLTNSEPAKFHIHTLLRIPNGGDYGRALIPLIEGEQQAFVWEQDKSARDKAAQQGHQVS